LLGKTYESPLQKAVGAEILGSDEFVEHITAKYLAQREIEREVPALRQLPSKPSAEKIIYIVEEVFGDNKKLARQAGMYPCHRYSGQKLREIGELFGVGPSAITEASRHFTQRIEQGERLARVVDGVKGVLQI